MRGHAPCIALHTFIPKLNAVTVANLFPFCQQPPVCVRVCGDDPYHSIFASLLLAYYTCVCTGAAHGQGAPRPVPQHNALLGAGAASRGCISAVHWARPDALQVCAWTRAMTLDRLQAAGPVS